MTKQNTFLDKIFADSCSKLPPEKCVFLCEWASFELFKLGIFSLQKATEKLNLSNVFALLPFSKQEELLYFAEFSLLKDEKYRQKISESELEIKETILQRLAEAETTRVTWEELLESRKNNTHAV
jgi:hypothetical protein